MADERPPFDGVPRPPPQRPPQPAPGQWDAAPPPPPAPPGQWAAPAPGQYAGPRPSQWRTNLGATPTRDPQAGKALGFALGGLICFGFILGAVAIMMGVGSRNRIRQSGGWVTGEGMATAAIWIGVVDILGWIWFMTTRF